MATACIALCALVLALATRSYAIPTSRILGGEDVTTNDFSFVVSLRLDNAHNCGGSIISAKHILTAAHCVVEKSVVVSAKRLSVRVGSKNQFAGGKVVQIAGVTVHPSYIELKNDLAILTLAEELVWSDKIKSIPYAKGEAQEPPVDAAVHTAGWGEVENGASTYKLKFTTLTVASESVCSDAYEENDVTVICLAHEIKKGSCKGDAGNGAVYESTLVAVSTFVIGACGSRYPDVYINVAHFASWIDSVLSQD